MKSSGFLWLAPFDFPLKFLQLSLSRRPIFESFEAPVQFSTATTAVVVVVDVPVAVPEEELDPTDDSVEPPPQLLPFAKAAFLLLEDITKDELLLLLLLLGRLLWSIFRLNEDITAGDFELLGILQLECEGRNKASENEK